MMQLTISTDHQQFLLQFQNSGMGTSSVIVDAAPMPSSFVDVSQDNTDESHRVFSLESLDISSSATVLRPNEDYQISRIMSRIDESKLRNQAVKKNLICFLDAFKTFLLELPSEMRLRLPLLSMSQDTDGDCIVAWATRKANVIFDIAAKWKDSFWCASSSGGDGQKSESAPLSEEHLGNEIQQAYMVLMPYV